jgi:YidC/Oxa1 family membrane protein insertase
MLSFLHTFLYVPIYNLLVFLVGVMPGGDVGLAVIAVTLIVKLITAPLALSALKTQRAMKLIEPEMKEIREKYKDDKETQAKETFALYKRYNVKPFASFLTLFIQLPVIISLYLVFRKEPLYSVDPAIIYHFIHVPAVFSPYLFGIVLISGSNIILAALAAITQYFQARYALPVPDKKTQKAGEAPDMQADFARAMSIQARFVLPLVIGMVAYSSGVIALYFITSNLFALAQEIYLRRLKHEPLAVLAPEPSADNTDKDAE